MKVVLFYHSLLSDWNHGNAHFLRGIATELIQRGHTVKVYEPANGWSYGNLMKQAGQAAVEAFHHHYPRLQTTFYDPASLDLDDALLSADLVIVHEWNDHDLVKRIGEHKAAHRNYHLLFHDTHHRSVTDAGGMAGYDLTHYDGVLAYGETIKDIYLKEKWARNAWTWHEAADTNVFKPIPGTPKKGDVVWIGNWGDNERKQELREFLIDPVRELGLKAKVYGVRYPADALEALGKAGIEYGGWLPNYKVPEVFAQYHATVHIPRGPYVKALPGIPTIRPFEALACGIPLISSPWQDAENLFTPGKDFLLVQNGAEMKEQLAFLLSNPGKAKELSNHGLHTILTRHTCAHRVNELLTIYDALERQRMARPVKI